MGRSRPQLWIWSIFFGFKITFWKTLRRLKINLKKLRLDLSYYCNFFKILNSYKLKVNKTCHKKRHKTYQKILDKTCHKICKKKFVTKYIIIHVLKMFMNFCMLFKVHKCTLMNYQQQAFSLAILGLMVDVWKKGGLDCRTALCFASVC